MTPYRIQYVDICMARDRTLVRIGRINTTGAACNPHARTHYRRAGDHWAAKIAAILSARKNKAVNLFTDGWIVEL